MKLLTADKMRELERRADVSGNSYAAMMERAGTLTAQAMLDRWAVQDRPVLVLAGPGNNGGDGLVCGRVLHDHGAAVHIYLWKREPREDDVNWRLCRERGIPFDRSEEDANLGRLRALVAQAGYIVDAFLGTGVTRPIEGLLKTVLETVKAELGQRPDEGLVFPSRPVQLPSPRLVVALDLPSGLNPDNGSLDPAALSADLTVTFAFPKVGQYEFPGAAAVGELVVADIGIRAEWAADVPLEVATAAEIRAILPARPRDSNKGTYGKAMLACGSTNFTGAPRLAAAAAGRVGAGLVTLAVPQTIHPIVASTLNEATYLPLPDSGGDWSPRAVRPLAAAAQGYEALLVGCGFGRADSTSAFVSRLFGIGGAARRPDLPALVIDADALNALSEMKGWWEHTRFPVPPIVTPHPGEMGRLTGLSIQQVQRDRAGIAARFARAWNAVVVLKGAFTVIAAPDGRQVLIPFADPALATAGTGDVLAGTIVGLLAQYRAASEKEKSVGGQSPSNDAWRAALAGAFVHGLAGQLAGREIGPAGVVAGDLVPNLPRALRELAQRD